MPELGAKQVTRENSFIGIRWFLTSLTFGLLGLAVSGGTAAAQSGSQSAKWYSQDLAGLTAEAGGLADGGLAGLALNRAANAPLAKGGPLSKVGPILADLYREHEAYLEQGSLKAQARTFQSKAPLLRTRGDMVVIDAVAAGDPSALKRDLDALGLTDAAVFEHMVSGRLPIAALDEVAGLTSLRFARPAMAMSLRGSVKSEGVPAMRVPRARKRYGVNGTGMRIGVLSDSYDCLGGAAADIASRDLPKSEDITILDDSACPGIDEGRAMMQLISDVAPRAEFAFHTAFLGQASFARGIKELAAVDNGGADVVVDDIIFFAEPMFQDGIIARAVNRVKAQGVPYFSAAGNGGRGAWDSGNRGFVSSGFTGLFGGLLHDFDPGGGSDPLQSFVVGTGQTIIIFQWDQPFASASIGGSPGSGSDLDFIVATPGGGSIITVSAADNFGGDAIEAVALINSGPPAGVDIAIELFSGPAPGLMKYVIFGPGSNDVNDPPSSFPSQDQTFSGTLYGHANAAGAMAVGAASFRKTPAFGVSPPKIEPFSAAGGTPIHFTNKGKRISPVIRLKPEIVAPDGTSTTFFGSRNKFGVFNPKRNHFFGTSAAAPHAAALAALMLELDPDLEVDRLYDILKETATDMNDPATGGFDSGFDFGTGHGLIDAFKALNRVDKAK